MFKRIFSLILCLALVLSAFAGCSSDKKDNDDEVDELEERIEELEDLLKDKNDSEEIKKLKEELAEYMDKLVDLDEGDEEYEELLEKIEDLEKEIEEADKEESLSTTIAETFAEEVVDNHPITEDKPMFEGDFGGAEFRILTAGQSNGGTCNDFGFEEENSEYTYLEQAQYERILTVERELNVNIVQDIQEGYSSASSGKPGPGYKLINNHVASGTDMYDLCLIAGYDVSELAIQGYLYNMNMIPGIDLTKSYWDQNAIESLAVKDVVFFTTGEITVSDNNAAYCIMFNKQLANDYNIENPYELVRSGNWTFEKLAEISKKVSEDLNQDGVMDGNDRYGLLVWDDSITGVVNAAGQRCCTVNANGEIELTLFNESTLNALDAYVDLAYDQQHALQYQRLNSVGSGNTWWQKNQGLFYTTLIGEIPTYREMEIDFGVLPYPKLSVSQKNHYTTISPYNSQFICVPLVVEDINMVGAVTEALAYYGEKEITPALYEATLKSKIVRDQESNAMLDIIFENIVYDIGYYYQIGSYNKNLIIYLRECNSNWSVMYDAYAQQAQAQLNTINDAYASTVAMWKQS